MTVKTAACPVPAVPPDWLLIVPEEVNPAAVYTELKIGLAAPAVPITISPKELVFPVEDSLRPADRLEIEGIIESQNYIFPTTWNRHHDLKLKYRDTLT